VGSWDNKLYALNGATGALKWGYTTGGQNIQSSPAIGADDTVYVGSNDNTLYALIDCPAGFQCTPSTLIPCSLGYFNGDAGSSICSVCPPGTYGSTLNATACTPCMGGSYSGGTAQTSNSTCLMCPSGSYCPQPSAIPLRCPAGYVCPIASSTVSPAVSGRRRLL
jgi:hypothetical protein